MRILVYGAGVQGCELAHRLLQNKKNVVTMLARGEWKERLDQRGLVIRHWAQCRTTVDRVATIDTLAPDDCYDLVFVTLQAGQLPDVLPILKQNRSEYFVFVGNDPHAVEVMQAMQRPADKIAFGFQSSGGHRDVDKVVSAHVGVGMTIGGATAPLSGVFRYRVKTAFEGAKYKLTFVSDMDGWLKCHLALILPACYLCYACSGDLSKATKEQRDLVLDAAWEACEMLKAAHIPVDKNGRYKIIVTELPYKVNKARLIENIADLVKDKRIEGISNIEDHSDRKGMHIEIDIKRDASPQIVLNQLFSYTQLQTTFAW